jgi:hypothetical protein
MQPSLGARRNSPSVGIAEELRVLTLSQLVYNTAARTECEARESWRYWITSDHP